jgi:hypothetical protein
MSKLTDMNIKRLMKLKKASDERIKCLRDMIKHEEASQLFLRPVLKEHCNHEYTDIGSFTVENNSREYRCKKCQLLRSYIE